MYGEKSIYKVKTKKNWKRITLFRSENIYKRLKKQDESPWGGESKAVRAVGGSFQDTTLFLGIYPWLTLRPKEVKWILH